MKKAGIVIGKILLGILTFVLCVALMLSTVLTIVVADIQVITNKDNLNTLISTFLTGSAPSKSPAGLAVNGANHAPKRNLDDFDMSAMASGDTSFLVEFVYDMLEESAGGEIPVTIDEVKAFVEESTIDDFLAKKGTELVSDFLLGENTTSITMEEIQAVIEENAALIESSFNIPLDTTVITQTIAAIEETGVVEKLNQGGLEALIELSDNGGNLEAPDAEGDQIVIGTQTTTKEMTTEEIINGLMNGTVDMADLTVPQLLGVFREAISAKTMWLCIGVCAVLIGLIFLTRWKKYYLAMIFTGVTLLITGAICMVPAILFWSYPDAVVNLVPELRAMLKMMDLIVDMTYPISLCVGIFGVLLIVGGALLPMLIRKLSKAKVEAPIAVETVTEEVVEAVAEEEPVAEEAPEVAEEVTEVAEEVVAEETAAEETVAKETAEEEAPVGEEEPTEV